MGPSAAIRAGAAYVELYTKDNKFVRGMQSAGRVLTGFGTNAMRIGAGVMAAGMAVVTPILLAAKGFAAFGDTLNKMSARTGISVEALSELKFAAEQSGGSLELVEKGVRKMQQTITEAVDGQQSYVESLDAIGVSVKELEGLAPEKQFALIADGISRIKDPTTQAARAMEIFGRAGTGLLPMMKEGAAGMKALMQEARELGLTMSTDDAQAAADMTDAWNRMKQTLGAVKLMIGAAVAPVITKLVGRVVNAAKCVKKWIDVNRSLIVSVLKIGAVAAAAGAVIMAIGVAIVGAGMVIGGIVTMISAVGTAIGVVGAVLAAILSPIGLVIAGLLSLGGYFLYTSGAGGKAIDWLLEKYQQLKDRALKVFGGIADALKAGDIALAGKILWLALKAEWVRGINVLDEKWVGFKEIFMSTWTEAVFGLAKIWVDAVASMQTVWAAFSRGLVDTWKVAEKTLAKGIAYIIAKAQRLDPKEVLANVEEDYQRQFKGRRESTAERVMEIEERRRATQGTLQEDRERAHVDRQKRYSRELADADSDLAKAQKELDAALEEARRKRERAEREAGKGPGALKDYLADAAAGLTGPAIGGKAAGTFSAAAAVRMGGGRTQDRIATATEETAKKVTITNEMLRLYSLPFH